MLLNISSYASADLLLAIDHITPGYLKFFTDNFLKFVEILHCSWRCFTFTFFLMAVLNIELQASISEFAIDLVGVVGVAILQIREVGAALANTWWAWLHEWF